MRNTIALPYIAGAAVLPRRIVKFSADATVIQGAAATDNLVAVSDALGAAAAGDRCESYVGGVIEVEAGGAVTRGLFATSDAVGRAVNAAPGVGVNNRHVGVFQASGVLGDVVEILFDVGSIQG